MSIIDKFRSTYLHLKRSKSLCALRVSISQNCYYQQNALFSLLRWKKDGRNNSEESSSSLELKIITICDIRGFVFIIKIGLNNLIRLILG